MQIILECLKFNVYNLIDLISLEFSSIKLTSFLMFEIHP